MKCEIHLLPSAQKSAFSAIEEHSIPVPLSLQLRLEMKRLPLITLGKL